jgi:hypothetical protein
MTRAAWLVTLGFWRGEERRGDGRHRVSPARGKPALDGGEMSWVVEFHRPEASAQHSSSSSFTGRRRACIIHPRRALVGRPAASSSFTRYVHSTLVRRGIKSRGDVSRTTSLGFVPPIAFPLLIYVARVIWRYVLPPPLTSAMEAQQRAARATCWLIYSFLINQTSFHATHETCNQLQVHRIKQEQMISAIQH